MTISDLLDKAHAVSPTSHTQVQINEYGTHVVVRTEAPVEIFDEMGEPATTYPGEIVLAVSSADLGGAVTAALAGLGESTGDPIHHPAHYNADLFGIETIQVTRLMPFNPGNAVKYIWRHNDKGKQVEDLRKAVVYLDWAATYGDPVALTDTHGERLRMLIDTHVVPAVNESSVYNAIVLASRGLYREATDTVEREITNLTEKGNL